MKMPWKWAVAMAALCLAGTTQATVVNRSDGTVLDTDTKLLWLETWNPTGLQTWETQRSWAENLTFAGSSDWHLPTIDQYATLYDWLTLHAGGLPSAFVVLPSVYWSSTDDPLDPDSAFMFYAPTGLETSTSKIYFAHATAVRSALPVPEPSSFALTALGLLAAVLVRARRSRRVGRAQEREARLQLDTP
jgi:hypothetical protein